MIRRSRSRTLSARSNRRSIHPSVEIASLRRIRPRTRRTSNRRSASTSERRRFPRGFPEAGGHMLDPRTFDELTFACGIFTRSTRRRPAGAAFVGISSRISFRANSRRPDASGRGTEPSTAASKARRTNSLRRPDPATSSIRESNSSSTRIATTLFVIPNPPFPYDKARIVIRTRCTNSKNLPRGGGWTTGTRARFCPRPPRLAGRERGVGVELEPVPEPVTLATWNGAAFQLGARSPYSVGPSSPWSLDWLSSASGSGAGAGVMSMICAPGGTNS